MKVIVAGVFDVIHPGHINMLMFCRQVAGPTGIVIVSLDTDGKVIMDKGEDRPIFAYNYRKECIEALNLANRIVFHTSNIHLESIIKESKPDYIIACDEYKGRVVGSEFAEVIYFKKDERFSSTKIIEACRRLKNS